MTTRISGNGGFNFNNLVPNSITEQTSALPKVIAERYASQTTPISNPNDLLAARLGTNYNTQRFKLETQLTAQTNSDAVKPTFQTIGGSWRIKTEVKKEDQSPEFYRDGEDTSGTTPFDQEYYQQKGSTDGEGWVRLSKSGGLSKSPEYKDKPRPDGMSDLEWRGWDYVKATDVPADVTTDGKTVAFKDAQLAQDQLNVLKRYVLDNNLLPGTWDEAKFKEIFGAKAGTEIKIELEKTNEVNGKTVYDVHISDDGLARLREGLAKYKAEVQSDATGGAKGQQQETNMAFDIPKVFVRAAIKTVQDSVNTAIEIIDPSIQTDPHNLTRARIGDIMDSQLPPPRNGARETALPRVNAEPIMPEYESDVMNRDIVTGRVNKNGVTVGKVTETAVELAAPVVIGKVAAPTKAVEGLGIERMTRTLPQGMSEAQFAKFSQIIKESKAAEYGTDIRIHGSRAVGKARASSDIDVAIRVSKEDFVRILRERFKTPNPGSNKEETMLHALTTGKIQRGELGLSGLGRTLEKELGYKVDISVILEGGKFDKGPWVQVK